MFRSILSFFFGLLLFSIATSFSNISTSSIMTKTSSALSISINISGVLNVIKDDDTGDVGVDELDVLSDGESNIFLISSIIGFIMLCVIYFSLSR